MSKLHIYPQPSWHEDAWIIGNRESLIELRDAINNVLDNIKDLRTDGLFTKVATISSSAQDGEYYNTFVVLEENNKIWNSLALPYNICDEKSTGTGPWALIDKDYYKELIGIK